MGRQNDLPAAPGSGLLLCGAEESGADARDGEIVAALIDKEEATVKTLRRKGGKVILEPANPSLSPVTYDRGVDILGRVVSVIRAL